jgi:hypothetical protein
MTAAAAAAAAANAVTAEELVGGREYDVRFNDVWQVARVSSLGWLGSRATVYFHFGPRPFTASCMMFTDDAFPCIAPLGTYTSGNRDSLERKAIESATAEVKQAEFQLAAAKAKLAVLAAAPRRKLTRRSPSPPRPAAAAAAVAVAAAAAAAAAPADISVGGKRKRRDSDGDDDDDNPAVLHALACVAAYARDGDPNGYKNWKGEGESVDSCEHRKWVIWNEIKKELATYGPHLGYAPAESDEVKEPVGKCIQSGDRACVCSRTCFRVIITMHRRAADVELARRVGEFASMNTGLCPLTQRDACDFDFVEFKLLSRAASAKKAK